MSDIDTSYLDEVLMDNALLSSAFLFDYNNPIGAGKKDQFIQSIARSKVGEIDSAKYEKLVSSHTQEDGC